MAFLDVRGGSLYYEVHGAGPWLVFVHGAGGNHLSWWQQVPVFASRFRCLIYDQRGWGRSVSSGPADPHTFTPDLRALLDHVHADRAALVGQSMGGWTVLGCALAEPDRVSQLVLTGTVAGLIDDDVRARLLSTIAPSGSAPLDARAALAADFPEREPVRTFLFEEIAGANPPLTPEFLRALINLAYSSGPTDLPMPVCFIAGEQDRLFPLPLIQRAHARLPRASLVTVPVAGHSVYFECPDAFNRALADFLGM